MFEDLVKALMPKVEELKAKDKNFAREFEARKDEMTDFAKLFYDYCRSKGSGHCAVFGSDDELFGQLVHFFHEPKGSVKSLDLNIAVVKTSGGGTAKSTKASVNAPKPAPSKPVASPAPSKPVAPPAPKVSAPSAPKPSAPVPPRPTDNGGDRIMTSSELLASLFG